MIEPHRQPNHAYSSVDALAISMQEFGRVELGYMEHLTGQSEEKIISELEYDRIFFDFQKKEYQLAEEYLSGDVRAKMEATQFEIQRVDSEMDRKIASTVLDIEDYQHYEPKNEVERKIMEYNPASDSYFAFTDSQEKYIESQQDNREFMVQVAMRHGIYASDKVSEILSDKPLIALETMRLCKRIGYSKPVNILILGCLRNIDEYFHRDNSEHDLMLYNFLKRHLAQYEGNLQAIKEQADNYGRHSDIGNIKEEWEQYQIDYQQRKNLEKEKDNPEIAHLQKAKARLEKNLAALELVKPKDLTAADIHVELGATWIPAEDIERFIRETFDAYHSSLKVHFSTLTGNWRIDKKNYPHLSTKALITYGVKEMNALALTELALNMKEPKIHKTVYIDDVEKKIVDREATIVAQQKQELIKQAFSKWIFADEIRRNRLVAY